MTTRLILAAALLILACVVLTTSVLLFWAENDDLTVWQVLRSRWPRCIGVVFVLWMAASAMHGRALWPRLPRRTPAYVINTRRQTRHK